MKVHQKIGMLMCAMPFMVLLGWLIYQGMISAPGWTLAMIAVVIWLALGSFLTMSP